MTDHNASIKQPMRIAVLISGSGTNLQAIIDQVHETDVPASIVGVISNKSNAFGLERAKKHNIAHFFIDHHAFDSREAFDQAVLQQLLTLHVDLVILAGFMRILTSDFVSALTGKMINIHPSLLPKYKGLNTHQRAIDAQDAFHGASVHFVTEELDGGQIILQSKVPIAPHDTADSLADKIHTIEHIIYPLVTKWLAYGNLATQDGRLTYNNTLIPETGLMLETLK